MRIALFSDIHGKILLPFKLAGFYQEVYNKKIDFILQCGDLGIFPDISKLDKATIKHAERDRDELGFHDHFVKEDSGVKQFLDNLNLNMYAVRGNHEDHDFLDEKENSSSGNYFSIDCYNRVFICKSAKVQQIDGFKFVGIGRIGDRKNRNEKRFIQSYEQDEIKKLIRSKTQVDVLISHDVSDDMTDPGYGMKELRSVLDNLIPEFHFYGHTGKPFSNVPDNNEITRSVKIKELEFEQDGLLPHGCMIILERNDNKYSIEVVPQDFLQQFTKDKWKYL